MIGVRAAAARSTRSAAARDTELPYWQATDRDEPSEAGPQRSGRGSRSKRTCQKALFPAISFRYQPTIGRLKILGPARGVRVRFPPPAITLNEVGRPLWT